MAVNFTEIKFQTGNLKFTLNYVRYYLTPQLFTRAHSARQKPLGQHATIKVLLLIWVRCDWSMRISLVILLVLSLVRMLSISKPLFRPGWRQVLQHKCTETAVQYICTVPSIVRGHGQDTAVS